jgi:acetyl-CoA synthetase
VADIPQTRNAKIMRCVIRAAYLGELPGDLNALVNPANYHDIKSFPD